MANLKRINVNRLMLDFFMKSKIICLELYANFISNQIVLQRVAKKLLKKFV